MKPTKIIALILAMTLFVPSPALALSPALKKKTQPWERVNVTRTVYGRKIGRVGQKSYYSKRTLTGWSVVVSYTKNYGGKGYTKHVDYAQVWK